MALQVSVPWWREGSDPDPHLLKSFSQPFMASSLHCEEQLEAVTSELITTFSFVDDANSTAGLEERVEALRDVEVLYKVEDYASRQQQATVSIPFRPSSLSPSLTHDLRPPRAVLSTGKYVRLVPGG